MRCTPSTRSGSWPRCSTRCRSATGFDTADVDDVVMGCGAGSGDHAMDIARMAALDAGWSLDAPGVTLNRFCGSGQQAVNFAAMGVLAGLPGPRRRRRRRVDVPAGAAARRRVHRQQPPPPRPVQHGGPGHLGRPDRHRRGLHAATSATSWPSTARTGPRRPSPRAASTQRSSRSCDDDGTLALDHEEFPRPGTTARRPGQAAAELREDGRRRHAATRTSPSTRRRCWPTRTSTRSATSTTPATPRASSTAPPPCSSPRPTTRGRTA